VDERARRRYTEVVERHGSKQPQGSQEDDSEYTSILEALARRDCIDSSREVSPLRPADDAVVVDTTDMTVEQVLDRVLDLARSQ
jgi:pantoate ligase/cytidylate kinase